MLRWYLGNGSISVIAKTESDVTGQGRAVDIGIQTIQRHEIRIPEVVKMQWDEPHNGDDQHVLACRSDAAQVVVFEPN